MDTPTTDRVARTRNRATICVTLVPAVEQETRRRCAQLGQSISVFVDRALRSHFKALDTIGPMAGAEA